MDYNFLTATELFYGISGKKIKEMLSCLQAKRKRYRKDEVIFHAGDITEEAGIVLNGGVRIESDDVWGNTSLLDYAEPGQMFAETYACAKKEPIMVNVVAAKDTEVLLLEVKKVMTVCSANCENHRQIMQNLLAILAKKNLNLSRRIFHTSSKTIRGRLLSYLSFQAIENGKTQFVIPFNRQQLADYLSVDRSALSKELGKMQKEGLISFEKNKFSLKTM